MLVYQRVPSQDNGRYVFFSADFFQGKHVAFKRDKISRPTLKIQNLWHRAWQTDHLQGSQVHSNVICNPLTCAVACDQHQPNLALGGP